ncbi:hypothetical protein BHM03_00027162 [Ensete ventricosum]|uniref:Uncharacterized protein n=1 Tax=Ensete ventricosum TaxID=4639 RepID=A0A445MHI8_ENSVE|nr:hypothetical protein BHM03_00027162 [Ensete ventricosum]
MWGRHVGLHGGTSRFLVRHVRRMPIEAWGSTTEIDDDDDDGRRWLVVFVGIWMDSFGSHFTARAGISLRTHHLVAGRSSTFLNRCRGPDLDRRTAMERCDCRCAPLPRKMGWV